VDEDDDDEDDEDDEDEDEVSGDSSGDWIAFSATASTEEAAAVLVITLDCSSSGRPTTE